MRTSASTAVCRSTALVGIIHGCVGWIAGSPLSRALPSTVGEPKEYGLSEITKRTPPPAGPGFPVPHQDSIHTALK